MSLYHPSPTNVSDSLTADAMCSLCPSIASWQATEALVRGAAAGLECKVNVTAMAAASPPSSSVNTKMTSSDSVLDAASPLRMLECIPAASSTVCKACSEVRADAPVIAMSFADAMRAELDRLLEALGRRQMKWEHVFFTCIFIGGKEI